MISLRIISTNHHECDALKQLLLKLNRLEELEDHGYCRTKEVYVCKLCCKPGHNSRTCEAST